MYSCQDQQNRSAKTASTSLKGNITCEASTLYIHKEKTINWRSDSSVSWPYCYQLEFYCPAAILPFLSALQREVTHRKSIRQWGISLVLTIEVPRTFFAFLCQLSLPWYGVASLCKFNFLVMFSSRIARKQCNIQI